MLTFSPQTLQTFPHKKNLPNSNPHKNYFHKKHYHKKVNIKIKATMITMNKINQKIKMNKILLYNYQF
jgi:hypothetical protein